MATGALATFRAERRRRPIHDGVGWMPREWVFRLVQDLGMDMLDGPELLRAMWRAYKRHANTGYVRDDDEITWDD